MKCNNYTLRIILSFDFLCDVYLRNTFREKWIVKNEFKILSILLTTTNNIA